MSVLVSRQAPDGAALCALVTSIAGSVARAFPPPVRSYLLDDAVGHIWSKVHANKLDPSQSEFPAAVWCSLYRRGIDLTRQQWRRQKLLQLCHPFHPTLETPDEMAVSLDRPLREMRSLLDAIRWSPRAPDGVDLFAVLLLHLRLGLAAAFGRALTRGRDVSPDGMSDFVAWCLPWSPAEKARPILPDLLPLGAAWAVLCPDVDVPPHAVSSANVCRALAQGRAEASAVKPSRWDQWTNRARRKLRSQIDDAIWDDLFAPLAAR